LVATNASTVYGDLWEKFSLFPEFYYAQGRRVRCIALESIPHHILASSATFLTSLAPALPLPLSLTPARWCERALYSTVCFVSPSPDGARSLVHFKLKSMHFGRKKANDTSNRMYRSQGQKSRSPGLAGRSGWLLMLPLAGGGGILWRGHYTGHTADGFNEPM